MGFALELPQSMWQRACGDRGHLRRQTQESLGKPDSGGQGWGSPVGFDKGGVTLASGLVLEPGTPGIRTRASGSPTWGRGSGGRGGAEGLVPLNTPPWGRAILCLCRAQNPHNNPFSFLPMKKQKLGDIEQVPCPRTLCSKWRWAQTLRSALLRLGEAEGLH